ncbi:xanthine dehydrogenase family protein molybdopterin-binding subunit [Thermoleophilia bacterium SCSIO 60948]|nr:xanthine dehydrogenase family protein molybdopterin-binding subunit [Thermoleophilia bacterium SCSIO 60948]
MTDVRDDATDLDGPEEDDGRAGMTRRRAVGYLIAAPFLIAGARSVSPSTAKAAIPTVQPVDNYDLSDLLRDSTRPTANLIAVEVRPNGRIVFDLPRSENGQGITTACAQIIADELDVNIGKVDVTLADARPELNFNQLTGGSVTIFELYEPLRTACALAKAQLASAAAEQLGAERSQLVISDGTITAPDGRSAGYGELTSLAAVSESRVSDAEVEFAAAAERTYIGRDQRRIDARDAVTGRKVFAMDLEIPGALPTMLCRPPTINGNAVSLDNEARIKAMPGVIDVKIIPNTTAQIGGNVPGGVAVRARTFGQCMAAIGAMKVTWEDGPAADKTIESIESDLEDAELPMTPALPGELTEERFLFHFRPGDPLETNCAVADVREDRAEIWSALKSPIWAKERIAVNLGLSPTAVDVHVTEGGGSFGRHLFCDAAFEAAEVSRQFGKPVKLMWHRADGPRQGRCHPMAITRVRTVHNGDNVVALDQRHTSVATDFTQGLGDALTATGAVPPGQNFLQYSQTVFRLTASVPYDFGVVTQELNEIYEYNTFNTSSVRNIYSPEMRTSIELVADQVAKKMGKDPFDFRQEFVRDERMSAVLKKLKRASNWGKRMPRGTAQGVGLHREYKGFCACVVEIDARPGTVNRKIKGAVTGPRVTKATFVVDVGLPINPLGLKAQMMGGIMDGIGQVLTYGLHLKDGNFLEASWDNAFYTRQWNSPPKVEVIVMPPTGDQPGGAGEFGVAASMAATASALQRATGRKVREFPVNQSELSFDPYPYEPPIPESPRNGLKYRNAPK